MSSMAGTVRTVFIFTNLPVHIEFRAGNLPLLEEKTVMEFDLTIKNPRDARKTRKIEGPYKVIRRKLKFETAREDLTGMTQYLEWAPAAPEDLTRPDKPS